MNQADTAPRWTARTVPPFTEIWRRLSVTDYVVSSGRGSDDPCAENEFVEERAFCLVVDGKHTIYEDLHTLDIRADVPTITARDLYAHWKEFG